MKKMPFETRPVTDTDKLEVPSGGDREIIDLKPGEEVIGKLARFVQYTVPTSVNPEGSTFYAVVLEDEEGNEGMLSSGADTTFGRQLRNAFAEKAEDETYQLKADFEGKTVRIAKTENVSEKSGQVYYTLGYEVLD